ncbi:AraC family transcriptional regulator [Cupriavidus consociatus]|uniref:AraC family transcriptional regulator n=1 Tax=Cupriavidus consociatus TaxID=2821357 RepID=UPI001AE3B9B9|nr:MULTISPECIES: AraC family transcriptional regulator [unclassified Cupriavidus]MBP0625274.1 AraC family transcriptional regulator [Cupriavidus sp. LEh25]MDK2662011.1 AraC family transcriptional regulator [Cupriavidus sp. LEh21]
MYQSQTRDLDEAIRLINGIYCPHSLTLGNGQRSIDTRLSVKETHRTSIVRLAYGADVTVDAGEFDNLFLIMKCEAGSGSVRQCGTKRSWGVGDILPVSANRPTDFHFGAGFSQLTIRPDKERLEALCAQWVGHALDRDLVFDLLPLSTQLAQTLSGMIFVLESQASPLPAAAQKSMEEALFSMLLTGHQHNYSRAIRRPESAPTTWLVRRFQEFVRENAENEVSIASISESLGVSIRTLQSAVEKWLNTTPNAYLRDYRLDRIRDVLNRGDKHTSVTEVAFGNGFFHMGRFSAYYKLKFGEYPSDTLLRASGRARAKSQRHS